MQKIFNLKNFKVFILILLLYLLVTLTCLVIFLPNWIYKNFGEITIEQILFTLFLPLKGTSSALVKSFIKELLTPSFILSSSLILIFLIIYDIKYLNNLISKHIYKSIIFIFKGLISIYKKYTNSKTAKKITKYLLISITVFFFILLPIINFILPTKQNKFYNSNKHVINENCLVAHACGQIDGKSYTNSLEAITQSIEKGYKFIEIDLCLTKNNEIVAMHDFKMFNNMTNTDNTLSTAQEIKKQKIHNKYTPLTAEEINQVFDTHKDLVLVTDKIRDYDILLDNFKFTDRMIVEVFSMRDYNKALKKGILYPALCFCSENLLKDIIGDNVRMVTTYVDFFNEHKNIFKYLHKKGVVIMVFAGSRNFSQEFMDTNLGTCCSFVYINQTKPIKEYAL